MRNSIFMIASVLAVAACASGGGSSAAAGGSSAVSTARPGNSNLITEAEISRGNYGTALEVVENLRPSMLRSRGATLSNPNTSSGISADQSTSVNVVVFLDEVRLGEASKLASIPAGSVREIRYINARDATTRWGTGVSSGVIQVISKR
jgi:hypothetical protein